MIELIPFTDTRVIGLKITGKIHKDEYQQVEKICDERLKLHEELRIYCELEDFSGISLPALVEDLRYGLGKIDCFSKEAVVAEKGWISKFTEIGNKLFKSIEVKHFLPEEKDKALTWIQE